MILDDPTDGESFALIVEQIGFPSVTYGRMNIAGRAQWADVARRAAPCERARLLRALRRHVLTLTAPGRRRLREYLNARRGQPIAIEASTARRRRVNSLMKFFGDSDALTAVVDAVVTLPRPVEAYVLEHCMFIVVGRYSNGWTSGPFPAQRLPVLLAGGRSDADVQATVRHECAHQWLEDLRDVATVQQCSAVEATYREQVGQDADLLIGGRQVWSELLANAAKVAWQ